MKRRFLQVDVFGARPYTGNPLAVVIDAAGLSDEQMQQLARWTNLSETAFLFPPATPEADYRVRIFTLVGELPFAGHPTLGSCHAWLQSGGRPRDELEIVQECGIGHVRLSRRAGTLAFAAPPLVRSGVVEKALLDQLIGVLGLTRDDVVDAAWIDNGPGWIGLLLRDAQAVLDFELHGVRPVSLESFDVGLVGAYPPGSESAIEVRGLFSDESGVLREDPVTGSLNASVAQWLIGSGRLTAPYVASQGTRLGRLGRPRIDRDDQGTLWIGGTTFTCVEGTLEL